jgi:serralysin
LGDDLSEIENLFGSRFGDRLNGDNGDNLLIGWQGDDTLAGNDGADTFAFTDGFGADLVLDFEDGNDLLDFAAHSATDFAQLTVSDSGADAIVEDGAGNSVTLAGAAGLLGADDFVF